MSSTPLLNSFTLFPNLPQELRIKIFEEAVWLFPRIVEVCQLRADWTSEGVRDRMLQKESRDSEDATLNEVKPNPLTEGVQNLSIDQPEVDSSDIDLETQDPVAGEIQPASEEDSSDVGDDDDASEENNSYSNSEDEEWPPPNFHPFYSPTALPPLFYTNSESREIALRYYPLCFPNADHHPASIHYNSLIDTLYFPAWAFETNMSYSYFELVCSQHVKDSIRKLAFETLVWYSSWEEGSINCQFQINEFKGLEELLLVERNPGPSGCGCCHEFEGPEHGLVSFHFEGDSEQEVLRAGVRLERGEVVVGSGRLAAAGWSNYDQKRLNDVQEEFDAIEGRDSRWRRPQTVRFVSLLRNGEFV